MSTQWYLEARAEASCIMLLSKTAAEQVREYHKNLVDCMLKWVPTEEREALQEKIEAVRKGMSDGQHGS